MSRPNRLQLSVSGLVLLIAASVGCAARPTPAAGPAPERGSTQSEQERDPLLREAHVVRQLGELCDAKLSQAAVAQSIARTASVRAFAASVYEDNLALREELDQIWQQFGLVELRTSRYELIASGTRDQALDLSSRKGSFVDRAFLDSVVEERRVTVKLLRSLAEDTDRPALRALIEMRFLPVASKSVARAEELLAAAAPDVAVR